MSFSDGKTAKYPTTLGTLNAVMDKIGMTVFETAAKTINASDESYIVPGTSPYVIRLRYVPQEVRDTTGNPIGVAITGLTEVTWDPAASPTSGKFMVNYINGEVKFNADKANATVQPAYSGTASWAWAESINEIIREVKAIQAVLGLSPQASFQTVKARLEADEGEVSTARGGQANLNARLVAIEATIGPMTHGSWITKQPNAQTGVLGSSAIVIYSDLSLKAATITNDNIKLTNQDTNTDVPLTLTYDDYLQKVTATHSTLVDGVYRVDILNTNIKDSLGRYMGSNTTSWIYGVGSALANVKPVVATLQVLSPLLTGAIFKGTITDTESDTISRVDIAYNTTNDVSTAIIQQLTGADIAAFTGSGGKQLTVSLPSGNYFCWARAIETLSGGGSQNGDWISPIQFTVLSDQPPATLTAGKLSVTAPTTTSITYQYNPAGDSAPTDSDDPTATISFNIRVDGGTPVNYTWTQIQASHTIGSLTKSVGGTYFVEVQTQAVTGGKTEVSGWVGVTSSAVPAHAGPSIAPTLGAVTVGNTTVSVPISVAASGFADGATASINHWYYRATGGSTWLDGGTGASPHSIGSLTNGTGYDISLIVEDTLGGMSARSNIVTGTPSALIELTWRAGTAITGTVGSVTFGTGIVTLNVYCATSGELQVRSLCNTAAINLTGVAKVKIDWENTGAGNTANKTQFTIGNADIYPVTDLGLAHLSKTGQISRVTEYIDVTSLGGSHFINVGVYCSGIAGAGSNLIVHGIWLEDASGNVLSHTTMEQ